MLQTIEAVIDENGVLRILDPIDLPKLRRVIVTILDEAPPKSVLDRAAKSPRLAVMEQRHAQGYARQPQTTGEVAEWESEQHWGSS